MRYQKKYKYDEVFALGFVSVFDQVLAGLPEKEQETVFSAYLGALEEDPKQYRQDAQAIEAWASGLSSPDELRPKADGDEWQQKLAGVAERAKSGDFAYSRFFAIGLFRLLELTGAKSPKALEELVNAMHVRTVAVNRDLMTYKGVLSKLAAAKELMKEIFDREKKKQAEREAAKVAAVAAKPAEQPVDVKA